MRPRLLCFDEIASTDFHAALAADFPRRSEAVQHTHDFSEVFYVMEGGGSHECNGREETLCAGDLRWIRPQDSHTFSVRPGQKMYFINIAFRQDLWENYRSIALDPSEQTALEAAPTPPGLHVPPLQRAACARLFEEMLRSFHTRPTRLALCRFWAEALLLLPAFGGGTLPVPLAPADLGKDNGKAAPSLPSWLAHACLAIQSSAALHIGVPRLVELCGVSPAHLARTLKTHMGLTPTEFVNARRLEQAALLLATTTEEILSIADECGFENVSYFYRLFGQRYGVSPRRYRLAARQAVMPSD